MNITLQKHDWLTLLLCLGLGILIEQSFFHGTIGISYLVFITAFYLVFFWRFKALFFTNRRIGVLIMLCVWLLSASYFLSSNPTFYLLNILVIPFLIVFHIILITSPKQIKWYRLGFIHYSLTKMGASIRYIFLLFTIGGTKIKKGVDQDNLKTYRKVLIGLLISAPLLFVIVGLLASADAQFERIMFSFPNFLAQLDIGEELFRVLIILFYTAAIFGVFQVLYKKAEEEFIPVNIRKVQWDSVIVLTVLFLLNCVYILFVTVQFKYFFSGTLVGDLTYAEYARRGFFELVLVTLLNLTILVSILTFIGKQSAKIKAAFKIMLTALIVATGVMLTSAFLRLLMYEDAYGFTVARAIAHSFMIFLGVILIYTLVKVWLEKLSLAHFYLISFLLYYTLMNTVNLNSIVVEQNLERYEKTGKIDVFYINTLSDEGVQALVGLYKENPDNQDVQMILRDRKLALVKSSDYTWQSFTIKRGKTQEILQEIEIE